MNIMKMEILRAGLQLGVNAPPIRDYICPYCSSSEGTMLSRDEEKVLFTCFRAKCSHNGSIILPISGKVYIEDSDRKKQVFKPNLYTGLLYPLDREQKSFLYNKFYINPVDFNIRMSKDENRFMIPLYTILGEQWGWGSRSYDPKVNRKFILYRQENKTRLYYPPIGTDKWRETTTVVLTEDVISAMKVSDRHIPAVSILGTSLSSEQINELADNFDNIIIWLDYDTWQPPKQVNPFWLPKAREMKRKMQLLFDRVDCVCSEKDPKDLDHNQIKEYLDAIT